MNKYQEKQGIYGKNALSVITAKRELGVPKPKESNMLPEYLTTWAWHIWRHKVQGIVRIMTELWCPIFVRYCQFLYFVLRSSYVETDYFV